MRLARFAFCKTTQLSHLLSTYLYVRVPALLCAQKETTSLESRYLSPGNSRYRTSARQAAPPRKLPFLFYRGKIFLASSIIGYVDPCYTGVPPKTVYRIDSNYL